MNDSIFTRIIRGEIPCHKVYEDEHTLAFLDIHPVQPGMVLVVTKEPVEDFTQLNPEQLQTLMSTVHKVANRLKAVFPEKKRIAVQFEGLDVPHVHAKLFPIDSGDEFRTLPPAAEPDQAVLDAMAKRLAF